MTTLESQIEEKKNIADGLMTQAKGVVREHLGNLSNDDSTRLAGKKDQLIGKLQANHGSKWTARNQNWILMGTAVVASFAVLTYFLVRKGKA